jgi:hypothetical protein
MGREGRSVVTIVILISSDMNATIGKTFVIKLVLISVIRPTKDYGGASLCASITVCIADIIMHHVDVFNGYCFKAAIALDLLITNEVNLNHEFLNQTLKRLWNLKTFDINLLGKLTNFWDFLDFNFLLCIVLILLIRLINNIVTKIHFTSWNRDWTLHLGSVSSVQKWLRSYDIG